SIIKESAEGGEIQDIEHNIVERVFELGDRKVNSLCTHRSEIVYFTLQDSWEEIKQKINQEKHSAYPVCKNNNLDEVIGIALLKDLFSPSTLENFQIKDIVKKPIFINENTYAYNVLEIFKKEKLHYAMVLDEYGTVVGIVTMDDVVDALVGNVTENDQDEYQLTQRNENSWLVDGQYSLIEFVKYFQLYVDEEIIDKYTTVSGLFIYNQTTMPEVGSKVIIENIELEIIDKDGQRIDKILINKLV
ncbi:MAG: hemolysin family protein, partial [Flavobacterium sp.]